MDYDKRENIISALLTSGWSPNLVYLNEEYVDLYWVVNKFSDERGKFHTISNKGEEYISDSNYLISPSKKYAVSIKQKSVTLHDASKNYIKILTLEIADIEVCEQGLKTGKIILLFKD